MKRKLLQIIPYIIALILAIIITPRAADYALAERGYKAYGGEIFIPLGLFIVAYIADELLSTVRRMRKRKKHTISYNNHTGKEEGTRCQ